jgi:hypothetical protein
MKIAKFTPPPWIFTDSGELRAPNEVANDGRKGFAIGTVYYGGKATRLVDDPEALATARLIITAPALFTACENLLALVALKYGNLNPDVNEILNDARAAIAKVRGE